MTHSSKVKIETITPEIARRWLETNVQNRPVKEIVIRRYAEAIKNGQWELNGETIKFSEEGVLLDGQHRLRAVVQSGKTIQSYVVRDLNAKVFDTIDAGASRSIGDLLALQGEVNNNVLGPALRLLYIQDQFGSVQEADRRLARLVTTRDLLETLERHPGLPNSVSHISGINSIKRYLSVPVAAYCHYVFTKIQPHHADAFFMKLSRTTDLEADHPIAALRSRLDNMSKSASADRLEAIAITFKAWNAYRQQKTIKSLRWSKVEDFPMAA